MKTLTTAQFIEKANLKHKGIYTYDKTIYTKSNVKVIITCPKHGSFLQRPEKHLYGQGCQECGKIVANVNKTKTTEEFIQESRELHGDIFDYSQTKYAGALNNLQLICKIHGIFNQTPANHLSGRNGCPWCKSSKGEEAIQLFLERKNIKFQRQVRFDNCRNLKPLPFDFVLYREDNSLIGLVEFQGEQHYIPRSRWGGADRFSSTQNHDKIKRDFAKENSISLLEISYKDLKNINDLLMEFINTHK